MESDANKLSDLRVKYLEMVQSVVSRMAAQGATIKNYCITLTTAVVGFGITLQRPGVVLLALLPITIFAGLDAQFLRLERHFRDLFDEVRGDDWSGKPSFEITATKLKRSYFSALFSWSVSFFYVPLVIGVVLVFFISRFLYGKFI